MNIPLYELEQCSDCKLKDKGKTIIVYCQSGIRSKKAINILKKNGFKNLYHLKGGLDEI
ncbi:MAG: rhodanese-like domain-containing protein [Clostridia bacterium]|nr:rhodanese-like domain-containing protein [Clostridia bacterium]